jgi:FkbM family methyltransferase
MIGLVMYLARIVKAFARVLIPNSPLAEIVELEAKRKQGKLGGGESIQLEVKTVIHFADKLDSKRPVIAFDIGANIGNYSAELTNLLPNVKLIAFEPSKKAFKALSDRFSNNPNVSLVNCALGDESGETNLFSDRAGSGLASLTRRKLDHLGISFEESESISMTTAQKWIEDNAIFPTIVKIDVEGHELDVLAGFGRYLESIQLIQFEFGGCNIDTRTYFKDFWTLLSPNFKIYRITPHGPQLIPEYTEIQESFMTSNFLAVNKA